jgi:hypothetical protein
MTLRALGIAGLPVYAAIALLSLQFTPDSIPAQRPILTVLALFALATGLYFLALAKILPLNLDHAGDLRSVLLFALLYRLLLLPSWPIQEIDFYRYLWDGRVTLHGLNPYRFSPWQLDDLDVSGEQAELKRLAQESDTVQTIFNGIHHREQPTVYPPLAQAVFAVVVLLTPTAAPLAVHVLILKIVLVLFDLGTVLVLARLLRRLGLPAAWCLAYAWCPLCLKEIANAAHLDAIAVFLTVLAFYLLLNKGARFRWNRWEGEAPAEPVASLAVSARREPRPPGTEAEEKDSRGWRPGVAVAALVILALAVLAKSYPLVLLPIVAAYLFRRVRWRSLLPLAAFAAVIILGYLPFAGGGENKIEANSAGTGPTAFLSEWEINDLLFMVVHRNLSAPGQGDDHWFVVVPAGWRQALHEGVFEPWTESERWPEGAIPAKLAALAVMSLILLGICAREAWRVWRQPEPAPVLAGVFRVLAWGWLLSSTQNPWYLLWALPFMVFDGRRSWFLLTGLAFIYYLRFWLEYHNPDVSAAYATFDFGLVWLEYVPFFVCLLCETIVVKRMRRDSNPDMPRTASGLESQPTGSAS